MSKLAGQWTGFDENGVYYRVDVDFRDGNYEGRISSLSSVFIGEQNENLFSWSRFLASDISDEGRSIIKGETGPVSIHKKNGDELSQEEMDKLKSLVEDFELPEHSIFQAELKNENLEVEWESHFSQERVIGGAALLTKISSPLTSISPEKMDWAEFKKFALEQGDNWVYRGQAEPKRLRTSFHRAGRSDVINYIDIEVVELERYMNIYTDHLYDVANDRSLGALLNLAQHHGYPTPLLDWTRSPFVAAFFAFENKHTVATQDTVTIFLFDEKEWSSKASRYAPIRTPAMIVRTLDLQGYGNTRVVPQQALTMYSNVDDVELLIKENEEYPGEFLRAVALPAGSRNEVLRELSLMGITWGSLFPGLDGLCKQLQRKHFGE